ncbi:MAG: nucleoside hydrolase [Acidobacteriota bacterium]
MKPSAPWSASLLLFFAALATSLSFAQTAPASHDQQATAAPPQLAILDTDIGDDIDDAFALALVLRSPEIKLLGITTTYADTELRARLVDRYLAAVGRSEIPVAAGRITPHANIFTQAAYANRQPDHLHPDAVKFLLEQIKAHPGQITLIEIGPMVNVQDAYARDPETFRKLKRVVLMGGSIYRGYGPSAAKPTPPEPEWNIVRDPAGAQALLASGVPVYMLPLDSTQIHLHSADRERIFSFGSFLTDQLTLLYHQWAAHNDQSTRTPTLYDPVAAAYAVRPDLCPMTPLHIEIDDKGFTRPGPGKPNVHACLKSDENAFLAFYLNRVAH